MCKIWTVETKCVYGVSAHKAANGEEHMHSCWQTGLLKQSNRLSKTRVSRSERPSEAWYLVMSSSAAWEHSCICDTSSVARSMAWWMYKWVRRTGFPESHFCLSSQDLSVLSKACSKPALQWMVTWELRPGACVFRNYRKIFETATTSSPI
jgi:hypothetical protein